MNKFCQYITVASVIMLAGCSSSREEPRVTQPVTQPVAYREPAPTYDNPGSLYNPNQYRSIYEDGRARRIGDIVTINVIEQQTAEQKVKTEITKDSDMSASLTNLVGRKNIFGIPIGAEPLFAGGSTSNFSGDNNTSRNNNITATLAARVINILPDGNMQIEAVRETVLNEETQFMVVTGIIRARDITANNTIASTQIANARIEYYGKGVLSQGQKPGWLMRFLNMVSPF